MIETDVRSYSKSVAVRCPKSDFLMVSSYCSEDEEVLQQACADGTSARIRIHRLNDAFSQQAIDSVGLGRRLRRCFVDSEEMMCLAAKRCCNPVLSQYCEWSARESDRRLKQLTQSQRGCLCVLGALLLDQKTSASGVLTLTCCQSLSVVVLHDIRDVHHGTPGLCCSELTRERVGIDAGHIYNILAVAVFTD